MVTENALNMRVSTGRAAYNAKYSHTPGLTGAYAVGGGKTHTLYIRKMKKKPA
jgi:hypothetical protein